MHPVFDPEEWLAKVEGKEEEWGLVIGPREALAALRTRKRLLAEYTPPTAFPADVFLFGIGEAPDRRCTKVGGLPFLMKNEAWPHGRQGNPLPFICQFNFTESRDIVGGLIEDDVLLVFGNLPNGDIDDVELELVWKCADDAGDLVDSSDVPMPSDFDAFYGIRWRTANYFVNDEYHHWSCKSNMDIQLACTLFATQISTLPFQFGRYGRPFEGDVICCLTPILAQTALSYPFVNHAEPIIPDWLDEYEDSPFTESRSGIRFPSDWLPGADGATLYFYKSSNGDVRYDWIFG